MLPILQGIVYASIDILDVKLKGGERNNREEGKRKERNKKDGKKREWKKGRYGRIQEMGGQY